jgi:hypothetical protein
MVSIWHDIMDDYNTTRKSKEYEFNKRKGKG